MINTLIAAAALAVSICSLIVALHFARRSFRPIVTAAVKTHSAGNILTAYDLVILNSGSLPARDIRVTAARNFLAAAFGNDASEENRERWLACFVEVIGLLQNGDRVSCSFGTTGMNDGGFWKYNSIIPITITYRGWFGKAYKENQNIKIIDSNSFTGYSWGDVSTEAS
jgi:hypothetical protein